MGYKNIKNYIHDLKNFDFDLICVFEFQNKAARLLKKCSLVQFPFSLLTQEIPFSRLEK